MTTEAAVAISTYEVMFLGGIAIGLVGMLSTAFVRNIRYARRLYWLSWLAAGGLMALATLDRGFSSACLVAVAAGAFAFMYAYLRTSYIKVGERIVAYTIPDSRPDPPIDGSEPLAAAPVPRDSYYGYLTASKLWWTLVAVTCAVGYIGFVTGGSAVTLALGVFTAGVCAIVGHSDARDGFPIARRQYVPFGVVVAASIPLFAAPALAYLATFWAAGGSLRPGDDAD